MQREEKKLLPSRLHTLHSSLWVNLQFGFKIYLLVAEEWKLCQRDILTFVTETNSLADR